MNENTIVKLPEDWDEDDHDFTLVAEGQYNVMVLKVAQQAEDRLSAEFKILDDGPFAARHLFQTFVLAIPASKDSFKAFLAAIKVETHNNELDVEQCKNKLLRVTVKHNKAEKDGKVYANIRGYAAAEA